ncbi:replication-relaxation family protein [Robertmurraya sp. DFI.2.37]|uniref:replication-relaxation family protein n=1 Tax=Robertmurraya sp. DFI.2.37 TaxID=3031819 RepID=UPI0012492D53|nr:replication-relaxation family protein [Robertmurraya sp. DFI.2.37]MDF1507609.1 replication-relaxation family protein [Robertmurraya sp. DFI.2.37]
MNQERMEMYLQTIDKLGIITVRQFHNIFKCGGYRNSCRIVSELSPYLHETRSKEKIIYLNKEGRHLIGSQKEVRKTPLFEHMLLLNDVYIYFDCPLSWKREHIIETTQEPEFSFGIQVKGLSVAKDRVIPDAVFKRNGYIYLVEVDNTRSMIDNKKKIQKYVKMWKEIRSTYVEVPKLCIFTTSEKRKNTFEELTKSLSCEVKTFKEIK